MSEEKRLNSDFVEFYVDEEPEAPKAKKATKNVAVEVEVPKKEEEEASLEE